MNSWDEIIIRGNKRMLASDLDILDRTARSTKPKTIVEIGSMDGTSSMCLGMVVRDFGGQLYCIEPRPTSRWRRNIQELFLEDSVTFIKAASPWVNTQCIPKPIDYLLIDGDHRTRWALVDYHFWCPMVRPGGMIAFHDYNAKKDVGNWVRRAIDIILEDDDLKEVEHNNTKDRGIIVFTKP